MFRGNATIASSQSFSMIQRRMFDSPWPASPVKRDEPLCTSAMRLPILEPGLEPRSIFILESMFTRKRSWLSEERVTRLNSGSSACVIKKRVRESVLSAQALQVGFPALAVRRVGEHEIKLSRREEIR